MKHNASISLVLLIDIDDIHCCKVSLNKIESQEIFKTINKLFYQIKSVLKTV